MRRVILVILAVVVVAQLVPVSRTNPPVTAEIAAPDDVRVLLRRACYDCHSHETRWPWYAWVAPASWLVAHDVHEAREELDFSAWDTQRRRRKKLLEIVEVLEEGEMPLWYYLPFHGEAVLSADEQARLVDWAHAERTRLRRR